MKFPEKYRIQHDLKIENTNIHIFLVPYHRRGLQVIATINPSGWEQVSVSLENRNPNWDEMSYIKKLFFDDEELCIQFHPRKSEHINLHNYCLHIWKPPTNVVNMLDQSK